MMVGGTVGRSHEAALVFYCCDLDRFLLHSFREGPAEPAPTSLLRNVDPLPYAEILPLCAILGLVLLHFSRIPISQALYEVVVRFHISGFAGDGGVNRPLVVAAQDGGEQVHPAAARILVPHRSEQAGFDFRYEAIANGKVLILSLIHI